MKISFTLWMILTAALQAADLPEPKFRAISIDTSIQIGYGIAVADVDGDKKLDVILADKNQIVWYQNPSWKKHLIVEKLTERDHVCIAAADINGDGKADIAAGAGWNPGDTINSGSVHYLIAPENRTDIWKPLTLPHEPTVHRMRWVKNKQGQFYLVVVPLHGRGNQGGKGEGVKILAYKPPHIVTNKWETTLLDASLHMTHNFEPVQWDDDTEEELLVAGKEGVFLLNSGDQGYQLLPLTAKLSEASNSVGAGEIRYGKLPGGRRFLVTVEPMHGNQVVVYLEPANKKDLWPRQVIDDKIVDGHALACGDFLGVGSDQFVVGWRAMGKPGTKVGVKLFTPLDKDGGQWRGTLVDDNTMACEDITAADLNDDGKLDLVAAGRGSRNVKIYWNEASK